MSGLQQGAALLCTVLGLAASAVVLASARDLRLAVGVLLQFLLAAGLLRLSADASWKGLLVAALVVGLRRLLVVGLGGSPRGG